MDPTLKIKNRLLEYRTAGLRRVGEESGVPWRTLWKIRSGQTANPRWSTVKRLAAYFEIDLNPNPFGD